MVLGLDDREVRYRTEGRVVWSDNPDPVTPTEQPDEQVPADEDAEVGTGAKMDPHGEEPESDPLPEGLEDEEES